ncbi:hypothetical protein [Lactococcus lactis]|uniref:Uncharacterized protein n=1 Tax=Lactococcus lactis subsp. lactis TaxID=1360 RepID=A0A0V8EBX1_LACLL|nr:hypothetical protein [Lactococcus lactis]KSU23358.1 hypothetical protein M20_0143 [Lactococcus lactis subsp. lactis]
MTETAKERIENEIKSVEKRLHSGRNAGKTYNTGVKEGLMIARAHVIDSSTTDKLSVEKLEPIGYYNEAHGFLHDEFDKDCYCQGGCHMEAVYTESQVKTLTGENKAEKLQERCDRYEKALTEIYNLHYCLNPTEKGKCGLIAHDALAAIGENHD